MIVSIAALMSTVGSTRAELMVGDKAPRLQTGKWVQGEPVPAFDSNHVYVVEFWATWCGPCVGSIPHLNQLWQKFKAKGVIVIGQDVWDEDDRVAPFMRKMGTNMTYRVALDDKSQDADGFMSSTWWKRKVNHHGIPTAFVINREGAIAWIGHPMSLKDEVLDEITSGKYDLARAATDYKRQLEVDDRFSELQEKIREAVRQKKWDDAQSALNDLHVLVPRMTNGFATAQLQILLGQKKFNEAYQYADAFNKSRANENYWQNFLAWVIATSDGPDAHCLGLAETMAQHAVELTHGTNSAPIDTLARVQFMLGKKPEAIATEEKAVSVEHNSSNKGTLERTLASYQAGKLP